jgi:hypothetical protein
MTGSSSKLLQIQGKWYQERKPNKNPEPEAKKTILHPIKTWFMNPGVDIRSVPFKKQISE